MTTTLEIPDSPRPVYRPSLPAFELAGVAPDAPIVVALDRLEELHADAVALIAAAYAARPRFGAPLSAPKSAGSLWEEAEEADAAAVFSSGAELTAKTSAVVKLAAGDLARVAAARAAVGAVVLAHRHALEVRADEELAATLNTAEKLAYRDVALAAEDAYETVCLGTGPAGVTAKDAVAAMDRALSRWRTTLNVGDWTKGQGRDTGRYRAMVGGLPDAFGHPRTSQGGVFIPAGKTGGFILAAGAAVGRGIGVVDAADVTMPDAESIAALDGTPAQRKAFREAEAARAGRMRSSGSSGRDGGPTGRPSRRVRV